MDFSNKDKGTACDAREQPISPGLYFARKPDAKWYNLIVEISGVAPFFGYKAWMVHGVVIDDDRFRVAELQFAGKIQKPLPAGVDEKRVWPSKPGFYFASGRRDNIPDQLIVRVDGPFPFFGCTVWNRRTNEVYEEKQAAKNLRFGSRITEPE